MIIPCPGIPLVFSRRYNSLQSFVTPLGRGWSHSFNWFLRPAEFVGPQSMAASCGIASDPVTNEPVPSPAGNGCGRGAEDGAAVRLVKGMKLRCPAYSSIEFGRGKAFVFGGADALLSVTNGSGRDEIAFCVPAGTTVKHENGDSEVLAAATLVPVPRDEPGTLPARTELTYAGDFARKTLPNGAPMRVMKSKYCGSWSSDAGSPSGGGANQPRVYINPDPAITNRTVTVTDDEGREYKFNQDRFGNYFPPPGLPMTLETTNNEYHLTLQGRLVYTFSGAGLLTRISDGWSNTVALIYSTNAISGQYSSNMLLRVEHSNGQALDFHYAGGRLVGIDSPVNLSVRFTYNDNGELVGASRSDEGDFAQAREWTSSYAYHTFITQRVNAAGTTFAYEYATNNAGETTPVGISTVVGGNYFADRFTYQDINTIVTCARGDTNQVFTYLYDPDTKKLLQVAGPCPPTGTSRPRVAYAYDDRGNTTNELTVGENGNDYFVVNRSYDAWHNVTNEGAGYCSLPSVWWQYGWDTTDQTLTSVTSPDGAKVCFEYTNASLAVVKQLVNSNLSYDTRYYYQTNGLVSSITNANGHGVGFAYDTNGFPASIIPQVGPVSGMTHDRFGKLTGVTLAGGRTVSMTRNALGWLTGISYPDGTSETFGQDGIGNVTNHVDVAGRTTRMTWLPMGRLASVTRILEGVTNQEATLRLDYDRQMNSLRITDELNRPVESYVLDFQDRPLMVSNVEGRVMSVAYGVDDFVKAVTRFDGTVVSNRYDSQGRVSAVIYPDGTNTYGYTPGGALTMSGSEAGVISNSYDGIQRLIQSVGIGPNSAVGYGYYPAGQDSNVTSVAGEVVYQNDAAERLSRQESPVGEFAYAYNATNGLVGEIQYPNGMKARYAYDGMDRVTAIEWIGSDSNLIRRLGYGYDMSGMITNVIRETGESTAYTYDSLSRLTSETLLDAASNQVHAAAWGYDLAGNRLQAVEDGVTNACTLGQGNRLATFGAEGAAYQNAAGCVTALVFDASHRLNIAWNSRYQMTSVSTNGAEAERYVYDAVGRRVMTVSGGVTNWHVYAGVHVVADLNSAGGMVRSYVWGPGIDNLLSMTVLGAATNTYYALKDHLGSVLALTDNAGNIVESYRYDAWGRTTVYAANGSALTASAVGNRYCWQGREYSWKTGLYYFRARWYEPVSGRWMSNDPIGIAGGMNQYVFCANNPVNFVDPDGLAKASIGGNVITVHKNDVDPWPSNPHGHIYDKGQVIDAQGNIFNKGNRQPAGQLGKKLLPRLLQLFDRTLGVFDFIIIPPGYIPEDKPSAIMPYVPGAPTPPGYVPRSFKKGSCGEDVPTEYIRWDLIS